MATYSKEPHTTVLPHVWRWPALYDAIQTVASMHGLDGKAERRVLRLINPAYLQQHNRRQRTTTHTMLMTLQLLKPGEIAHDHRHNFAAFRFILKGRGAYTVVEGEEIPMAEGDLMLTPSMTWHGHRNDGEPVVWLDGLDNPLLFLLQAITWEAYPGGLQPIKERLRSYRAACRHDPAGMGKSHRASELITCTTNGKTPTRSCNTLATGHAVGSTASRSNTSTLRVATPCRPCHVSCKCFAPAK